MALHPDWRAFIELLNSHGVEYVVVGAFAVAQHGHVRTTGDIDVLVRNSQENAERVTRALDAFGMGSLGLRAADFTMSYSVIQLGQAPVRIDILTTCSGVTFEEVWAGKLMITIDGVPVNVMGRKELVRNKRTTGRPQDLADISFLDDPDSQSS